MFEEVAVVTSIPCDTEDCTLPVILMMVIVNVDDVTCVATMPSIVDGPSDTIISVCVRVTGVDVIR